jgi:hypothetical protein
VVAIFRINHEHIEDDDGLAHLCARLERLAGEHLFPGICMFGEKIRQRHLRLHHRLDRCRPKGARIVSNLKCKKRQRHNDEDDADDFGNVCVILDHPAPFDLFLLTRPCVSRHGNINRAADQPIFTFSCFSTGAVSGRTPRQM